MTNAPVYRGNRNNYIVIKAFLKNAKVSRHSAEIINTIIHKQFFVMLKLLVSSHPFSKNNNFYYLKMLEEPGAES
jgi:hypothetical protein